MRSMNVWRVCASSPIISSLSPHGFGVEPTLVTVGSDGVTSIRYRPREAVVVVSFADRPRLILPIGQIWHMTESAPEGANGAEQGA